MAPKFEWWTKGNRKGTPVVVKMENPNNWSMVEIESPSEQSFLRREKSRNKNARQLTWVLLLKAHRAAGCLTSLGSALITLGTAVRRRIAARDQISSSSKPKFLYSCLKLFLFLSLILLGFEIAAYFKGWHFATPKLRIQFGFRGFFDWVYTYWVLIRVEFIAPPLQFLANACIVLFLVQSLDRLVLCLGCFWIRIRKIKPVLKSDSGSDLESGENGSFLPMVLVQIPMCNEKEVNQNKLASMISTYIPGRGGHNGIWVLFGSGHSDFGFREMKFITHSAKNVFCFGSGLVRVFRNSENLAVLKNL